MSKRPQEKLLAVLQQGIALHNAGLLMEAETVYREALKLAPRHQDALHLLGLCRLAAGAYAEAERLCRAAIGGNANIAMFHNTLGEALRRQARIDEAQQCFERALRLDPNHLDARANLGLIAEVRGNIDEAAQVAIAVFRARPANFDMGARAAALLAAAGQPALLANVLAALLERIDTASAARLLPSLTDALTKHGFRQHALTVAERWQQLTPHDVAARTALARALRGLHRETEAIPIFEALMRERPGAPDLLAGIAVAFQRSGHPDKARLHFDRALERLPDDVEIKRRSALLMLEEGQLDEAISTYRKLVDATAQDARAQFELAVALLMAGEFGEGWAMMEAREHIADCDAWIHAHLPAAPQWRGEPLIGKHLLVLAEQGAGDIIQFARFLAPLSQQCERLTVETTATTAALVASAAPGAQVIARGDDRPDSADAWCRLMSLPHLLGIAGRVTTPVPYLHPDPTRVAHWQARLGAVAPGRKVGICWAGARSHSDDPWRSIPASMLAALDGTEGIHFICLQKERRDEGIPPLGQWVDWMDEVGDFADTAALVSALDGVITVDTSIAHVAGALGIPTALLVIRLPDWRWQLGRSDCAWYPSIRLIRQSRHGDWQQPLEEARRWLDGDKKPAAPPETPMQHETRRTEPYLICDTRYGTMLVNCNDQYVGRSLIEYGEFSNEEITFIDRFIGNGDVVIDAGANIGALTLPFAKKVGPSGRVVAFEPQRLVFQMLCANLAMNGILNVDARQMAVGAAAGVTQIPDVSPEMIENFGGIETGRGATSVAVTTIDELKLDRCAVIKADVEGMESALVRGAESTIRRLRPVLYLENDRRDRSAALIELLFSLDYALWWHAPPLYSPTNFRGTADNHFGSIVSVNLVGIPRESGANFALRPVTAPDDWYFDDR